MEKKWLFRVDPTYTEGKNIVCKDPNSKKTINEHVAGGSTTKTKFISCTANLPIAVVKYSSGTREENKQKREPIVLIDFQKMKSIGEQENLANDEQYIYDFTDEEQITKHLSGHTTINRARSDRECVVNKVIPAECCREIPPILVDVLTALETNIDQHLEGCRDTKRKNEILEVGKTMSDNILNKVMQGDTKTLNNCINRIPFNDLEKRFISLYYGERNTLDNVASTLFGEIEQGEFWANAIQTEIVKKIIQDWSFLYQIHPNNEAYISNDGVWHTSSRNEFVKMITDSCVLPGAWVKEHWHMTWSYGKEVWTHVSTKFLNKFRDCVPKKTKRGKDKENLSATAVDRQESGIKFFGTIFLKINNNLKEPTDRSCERRIEHVRFPSGMVYEMEGDKIISAKPRYIHFNGETKQFNRGYLTEEERDGELVTGVLDRGPLKELRIGEKVIPLEIGKEVIEHAIRLGEKGDNGKEQVTQKGLEAVSMTSADERMNEANRQSKLMEIDENSQESSKGDE